MDAGATADARAAYDVAREAGDVDAMTEAALRMAAGRLFGTVPGPVPAFLHEAYTRAAPGAQRARVAVALARTWGYGGHAARAAAFAEEAIATAEAGADPVLLAAALDASLLVRWGPDDLAERLRITRRLEDTVSHLADVEPRLTAHLWRLTTALECLDLPAVQRQVRALEALAEESGSARVRFFAAARRGMYALLTGDLAAVAAARGAAVAAGTEAGEGDTYAVERFLTAYAARQAGDTPTLLREAALYEEFGGREGIASIAAEGAVLWVAAGRAERAEALLHQLAGADLTGIPRDVDWLLTVTCLAEVAAAVGAGELCAAAVRLLEPYAGRGVANAGVGFGGAVDDYLYRALLALGRTGEADQRRLAAVAAYGRLGATWWLRRVAGSGAPPPGRPADAVHLHPAGNGVWTVGRDGAAAAVPETKGLRYLRLLLARPGVEVPALELSDAVAGHAGTQVADGDVGPLLDRQALTAYRRRLGELEEELAEADAWADPVRSERLGAEREALLEQVRAATGLGGRPRGTADSRERARVAVRKAVAAALDRIEPVDPALARLLRDTVHTGTACRYEPDPGRPVRWLLDEVRLPGQPPAPRPRSQSP